MSRGKNSMQRVLLILHWFDYVKSSPSSRSNCHCCYKTTSRQAHCRKSSVESAYVSTTLGAIHQIAYCKTKARRKHHLQSCLLHQTKKPRFWPCSATASAASQAQKPPCSQRKRRCNECVAPIKTPHTKQRSSRSASQAQACIASSSSSSSTRWRVAGEPAGRRPTAATERRQPTCRLVVITALNGPRGQLPTTAWSGPRRMPTTRWSERVTLGGRRRRRPRCRRGGRSG